MAATSGSASAWLCDSRGGGKMDTDAWELQHHQRFTCLGDTGTPRSTWFSAGPSVEDFGRERQGLPRTDVLQTRQIQTQQNKSKHSEPDLVPKHPEALCSNS